MHQQGARRIKNPGGERELSPTVKDDPTGIPNRNAVSAMVITDGERWIVGEDGGLADRTGKSVPNACGVRVLRGWRRGLCRWWMWGD
jgi:hypothetical protein